MTSCFWLGDLQAMVPFPEMVIQLGRMMSSVLDSLDMRCLRGSYGERAGKKKMLGRVAEPGLEPWSLGPKMGFSVIS